MKGWSHFFKIALSFLGALDEEIKKIDSLRTIDAESKRNRLIALLTFEQPKREVVGIKVTSV
jgi:hypothetical protein